MKCQTTVNIVLDDLLNCQCPKGHPFPSENCIQLLRLSQVPSRLASPILGEEPSQGLQALMKRTRLYYKWEKLKVVKGV